MGGGGVLVASAERGALISCLIQGMLCLESMSKLHEAQSVRTHNTFDQSVGSKLSPQTKARAPSTEAVIIAYWRNRFGKSSVRVYVCRTASKGFLFSALFCNADLNCFAEPKLLAFKVRLLNIS